MDTHYIIDDYVQAKVAAVAVSADLRPAGDLKAEARVYHSVCQKRIVAV